jgi:hypothetical protein
LFQDTALSTELIQAFLETHYRVHQHGPDAPPLTLRVGQSSAGLAALHQAHGADCSAFLTAYNPFAQQVDDASNLQRQEDLKQELSSRSLIFLPGEGQHPTNGWPAEPSVLVLGLSLEDAKVMGRKYEQAAIVWSGPAAVPELVLLQ